MHDGDRERARRARDPWRTWYASAAWQRCRAQQLNEHPLCVDCQKRDIIEAATEVDHIIPHRGDPVLFWSSGNWQSLCGVCHRRKTRRGE